jgi:hypothetical protein
MRNCYGLQEVGGQKMDSLSQLKNRFGQPEEREIASNSRKVYDRDMVFRNLFRGMGLVGRPVVVGPPLMIQETYVAFLHHCLLKNPFGQRVGKDHQGTEMNIAKEVDYWN